ncbi:MAG TPA: STAS domain-containing protein [Thiothrix sp.]|nr:STAS domain-containing protein [Thiothrix sp.]
MICIAVIFMKIEPFSHLTVIYLPEALTRKTAENLSHLINSANRFEPRKLVLDMEFTPYATIAGLKHLLSDYENYQSSNLRFIINRTNQEVHDLLTMAGFWLIFERECDLIEELNQQYANAEQEKMNRH